MSKVICNGDSTVVTIPQSTSDLTATPSILATPDPAITQAGTSGNTVASYQLVAVNAVGQTLTSAIVSTNTSNAQLSSTNYNVINTPLTTGVSSFWVYRVSSTQLPRAEGFIGAVAPGASLNDTGLTADGPAGQTGTAPLNINNSSGQSFAGNSSFTSISGATTSPTTPLIVVGRLQVGPSNSIISIPRNVEAGGIGSVPGIPTSGILLASGAENVGNSLYLWNTNNGNAAGQIVHMMSGGTFSSPTNTWQGGGIGDINSVGFVGGSVQDWRTYTIIEYGSSDSGNPTIDNPHGKIQLGVVNGTVSARPGFVVGSFSDKSPNRTINTNLTDQRWYNIGYPNTYNGESSDFERTEATWNTVSNTFSFGTTAGGSGTLRPMKLTGDSITISAPLILAPASNAPTSAGTPGTEGEIIYFGGFLYFCTVTGTVGNAAWNKLTMTAV